MLLNVNEKIWKHTKKWNASEKVQYFFMGIKIINKMKIFLIFTLSLLFWYARNIKHDNLWHFSHGEWEELRKITSQAVKRWKIEWFLSEFKETLNLKIFILRITICVNFKNLQNCSNCGWISHQSYFPSSSIILKPSIFNKFD